MLWLAPTLTLLLSYLLGSIPFGLVLTRLFGAGDLRAIGSGNIGATNVLRTGRKGLALATLLLDGGKGAVAVLVARAVSPDLALLAALGAFFGHCWPIWLGFRGGKGVATYIGITLALAWPVGLATCAGWLIGFALSRISSVGGMTAAIVAPVVAAIIGAFGITILLIALALLVLWKHRANIGRILDGTEPRVGKSG